MSGEEAVMVIPREDVCAVFGVEELRTTVYDSEWYSKTALDALHALMLDRPCWSLRKHCETDPALKQIIPYILITAMDPEDGEHCYLTYFRTKKSGEERLQGKRSLGIGGHITNPETFLNGLMRELHEELETDRAVFNLNFIGFVNDESNDVGKVHLGVLVEIEFPNTHRPTLKCDSLAQPEWIKIQELKKLKDQFEVWSQLTIDYITENI